MLCAQFLGVQIKILVDTMYKFSVLSLNSKKSVPIFVYKCSILSATHGSAHTYFYVGMSFLTAKRRKIKFIVKS